MSIRSELVKYIRHYNAVALRLVYKDLHAATLTCQNEEWFFTNWPTKSGKRQQESTKYTGLTTDLASAWIGRKFGGGQYDDTVVCSLIFPNDTVDCGLESGKRRNAYFWNTLGDIRHNSWPKRSIVLPKKAPAVKAWHFEAPASSSPTVIQVSSVVTETKSEKTTKIMIQIKAHSSDNEEELHDLYKKFFDIVLQ